MTILLNLNLSENNIYIKRYICYSNEYKNKEVFLKMSEINIDEFLSEVEKAVVSSEEMAIASPAIAW